VRAMEWLNYHHLRYFWTVAKEGGLRQAAEKLHVSPPSISAQIRELEESLGEKLFQRSGRGNKLTDAGQIVLRYAEEIFTLGQELLSAVKRRPTARTMRLYVGVCDSLPKLVTYVILKPVFIRADTVHVICREGKMEDLLAQLAAHRLDIVLSDEPATSSANLRAFNHLLGESGVTICAAPGLAAVLRRRFPQSLDKAPALLPLENSALRRALEQWFRTLGVEPRVVAEFEDAALMKVMAAHEQGFLPVPTVVASEAVERYGLKVVGATDECRGQFYAITAERKITHPLVSLVTENARTLVFS
jgi:LysR family transcriptional regulator, transcriptional activator of nhaA